MLDNNVWNLGSYRIEGSTAKRKWSNIKVVWRYQCTKRLKICQLWVLSLNQHIFVKNYLFKLGNLSLRIYRFKYFSMVFPFFSNQHFCLDLEKNHFWPQPFKYPYVLKTHFWLVHEAHKEFLWWAFRFCFFLVFLCIFGPRFWCWNCAWNLAISFDC